MTSFFTADRKKRGELSSRAQISLLLATFLVLGLHLAFAFPPTARFEYNPDSPTVEDNVTFNATTSSCDPGLECNYSWDFTNDSVLNFGDARGNITNHSFSDWGDWNVSLNVSDSNSSWSITSKVVTVDNLPPTANFSYDPSENITVTDTITFNASNSTDPEESIDKDSYYQWDNDSDGDYADHTGISFQTSFDSPGDYNYTLRLNDDGGLVDYMSKTVTVNNTDPVAAFTYLPDKPLVSEPIHLDAASSSDIDNNIENYTWDLDDDDQFGEYANETGVETDVTFDSAGNYQIGLNVTDSYGGWNVTREVLTVHIPPVAQFSYSPSLPVIDVGINESVNVSFNGVTSYDEDGTVEHYYWDLDDDSSFDDASGNITNHTFTAAGDYKIGLKVYDNDGVSDTQYNTVDVNARPVANYTYSPHRPLPNVTITFNASVANDTDGTIDNYAWDLDNDGSYDEGVGNLTVNKSFPSPGIYVVSLNVTDNQGTNGTYSENVTINSRPVANFSYTPPKPIKGETTTFNGSLSTDEVGNISSYTWSVSNLAIDSFSGEGNQIWNVNFAEYGNGTVTLNVTDNDRVWNTTSENISVYARPVPQFTSSPAQPFRNETITFNASDSSDEDGEITNYQWDLNGNGSYTDATGNVSTANFSSYGNHTIGLKITDDDSIAATLRKNVTVYVPPVANFSFDPAIPVINETVTFNASLSTDLDSNITTYTWRVDGICCGSCGGPSQLFWSNFSQPGNHSVKLTVEDEDGLTDSLTKNVSVNYRPDANFTFNPPSPRPDQNVTFNASLSNDRDGSITNYAWDLNGNGSYTDASGEVVVYNYSQEGNYTVSLNITDNEDAWRVATRDLTIKNELPVANFTYSPQEPDTRDTVTFDASQSLDPDGQIVNYRWDTNQDGNYSDESGVTFSKRFESWGTYTISLNITDDNDAWNVSTLSFYVKKSGAREWIRSSHKLEADKDCSDYRGNCLGIEGDDITLDCQGHRIVGNHSGKGIHIDYWESRAMDNITVKNCVLVNFTTAIYEGGSSSSQMAGYLSNNNLYLNNTIKNPSQAGIELVGSVSSVIEDNEIITGSKVPESYGIGVRNARYVYLGNNSIRTNESSYTGGSIIPRGIYLYETHNSTLTTNEIRHPQRGIELQNSDSNQLVNFTVEDAHEHGLILHGNSNDNTVADSNISGSDNSHGVRLSEGTASDQVTDNVFVGNTINGNTGSNGAGLYLDLNASNNRFYLNQFTNNYRHVSSESSGYNLFNSSTSVTYDYAGSTFSSTLGNYWQDYDGSDSNNDGIGDTAYAITGDRDDAFPLIATQDNYKFEPWANFSSHPRYPTRNATIRLYAGLSYDVGGSIASYGWDLDGDGIYNDTNGTFATTNFSTLGAKTIGLNVTDNDNNSVTVTRNITINAVPTAD